MKITDQVFFVIDSDHLDGVEDKFAGHALSCDGDSSYPKGDFVDFSTGDKTSAKKQNKILIQPDKTGDFRLFLYRKDDSFAVSNSLFKLMDYLSPRVELTLNREYITQNQSTHPANYTYKQTIIKEIEQLPEETYLEVDVDTKELALKKMSSTPELNVPPDSVGEVGAFAACQKEIEDGRKQITALNDALKSQRAETEKARRQAQDLQNKLNSANARLKESINPAKVSYARVDIKNGGADSNDVEVLSISDANAKVEAPKWMRKNGMGRMIKSNAGALSLKLKCTGSGKLTISLKGDNFRGKDGKRLPVWVTYSKLVVDGKLVFDDVKLAWHDAPQRFSMDVKDGQIVDVQAEWIPDCVSIGSGLMVANSEYERVRKLLKGRDELMTQHRWYETELKARLDELDAELEEKRTVNTTLTEELLEIRSGLSFKLGRVITYIPRKLFGKR